MSLRSHALLWCLPLIAASCAAEEPRPARSAKEAPYLLVLGTAQDGGSPQLGSERVQATERDPSPKRLVASLLVVDPRAGRRWLIDATPDIREQTLRAEGHPSNRDTPAGRPPLFEGIFLTHAHMGHYTGLLHLGPEAYGAEGQPVYGSRRMLEFLETNGPWDLLVQRGHVTLRPLDDGVPVALAADLTITPIAVPHRDEYSDTFGFVVRGPSAALLYIPDIDKWERWDRPVETLIAEVDHALVDGTFFSNGEVPGRDMAEIPHPFIEESLARFAPLAPGERSKIVFIHLNHTNPAADPGGVAQATIEAAGASVAREGQRFPL